jgi:hypothetical protein
MDKGDLFILLLLFYVLRNLWLLVLGLFFHFIAIVMGTSLLRHFYLSSLRHKSEE